MLNNFWVNICIMLFGVVIAALSQILLKKAAMRTPDAPSASAISSCRVVRRENFTPRSSRIS